MDNSSVLIDNSQLRFRIGEVIDTSVGIIEKGTLNIFKELNKMREEYSGMINKFMEFCEKENINIDYWDENNRESRILDTNHSRGHSNEKEREIGSRSFTSNNKQYKFPTLEYKKLKLEKLLENKYKNNNNQILAGNLTPTINKTHISHHSHFIGSKNIPISIVNTKKGKPSRSKTPVGKASGLGNRPSGSSSHTLQEVILNRHLPKIGDKSKMTINHGNSITSTLTNNSVNNNSNPNIFALNTNTSTSTIQTTSNNSGIHFKAETPKKVSTPNHYKIDLKNFLSSNNTNYNNISNKKNPGPKSFIDKDKFSPDFKGNIKDNKVIFNKLRQQQISDNSSSNTSSISINTGVNNMEGVSFVNNVSSTPKNKSNLNINVSNVNINVNNNLPSAMNSNNLGINNKRFVDDRKLSILDIAGGGPLIMENRDINNLLSLAPVKKSVFNKMLVRGFTNKMTKFIYIFTHSDVVPIKTRLILSRVNRKVYDEYSPKDVARDYYCLLNNRICNLEGFLNNYTMNPEIEKMLTKPFIPSKTAQNNLNFISREEESKLGKESLFSHFNSENEAETIRNIFRVIYTLLRTDYENIDSNKLASHLVNNLMPKLRAENLKNLFMNVICNNLTIKPDCLLKINHIVELDRNIFNSPGIFKLCKPVSFLCFILKEIYDYLNLKTEDGVLFVNLRKYKLDLKRLKDKFEKVQSLV